MRVYVGQSYDGSDCACFAFHQLWEGAEGDIDVDEAKADSREDVSRYEATDRGPEYDTVCNYDKHPRVNPKEQSFHRRVWISLISTPLDEKSTGRGHRQTDYA